MYIRRKAPLSILLFNTEARCRSNQTAFSVDSSEIDHEDRKNHSEEASERTLDTEDVPLSVASVAAPREMAAELPRKTAAAHTQVGQLG